MSLESRLAYYPNNAAADDRALDDWIAIHRTGLAAETDRRVAVLGFADEVVRNTREHLAGMLTSAVERLVTQPDPRRYRLAWRNAAQRAENYLAAVVEADAERDFLRAQLKERDAEVAQLVARLAEYTGITS